MKLTKKITPITGTDGNDTLEGNLGKDTLMGGNGDDVYLVNVNGVKIHEKANAGIDSVQSKINYTLESNVENLKLLGFANLNGTGNELNNVIVGNDGKNTLNGMNGNDTLIGGRGVDKLTGGKGADTFLFTSINDSGATPQTRDVITDFRHDEGDLIDLSQMGQNFSFIGNQPFNKTNATGQLRFDAKQHILFGSTNADSQPEFSILLNNVNNLTVEDFILKSVAPSVPPSENTPATPATPITPATPTTATTPTTSQSPIFIKSTTNVAATSGADSFNMAVGNYTVTISGFAKGDKLNFFPAASITVKPDVDQTDGIQTLTAVDGETFSTVTVVLTGLTATEDTNLFNVASFNNVFGAGTIS